MMTKTRTDIIPFHLLLANPVVWSDSVGRWDNCPPTRCRTQGGQSNAQSRDMLKQDQVRG